MRQVKYSSWSFIIFFNILSFFATYANATRVSHPMPISLYLYFDGVYVSADVRDVPLATVMNKLASQAEVEFYTPSTVGKQKISLRFKKLPLEDALKRLLKGMNYAFIYHKRTNKNPGNNEKKLISVHVVSSGSRSSHLSAEEKNDDADNGTLSNTIQPPLQKLPLANDDVVSSTMELNHTAPVEPEPVNQIAELQAQVDELGEDSLPLIIESLMDKDVLVRAASVNLLLNDLSEVVPADTLSRIALEGENPKDRIDALNLLVDHFGKSEVTQSTLEKALQDADRIVRKEVREMSIGAEKNLLSGSSQMVDRDVILDSE